jgi:hypothetical protein
LIEARLYENGRNHKKHIRHKEAIILVPFALLVVPSSSLTTISTEL